MNPGGIGEPMQTRAGSLSPRWTLVVAASALIALSIKLFLALTTFGTNDVYLYQGFLSYVQLRGPIALYSDLPLFIHPPFIIHVMRLWGWLADTSGVAFQFWLKLPSIAADVGTLWITFKLLQRENRASPWALLLLALAPASIMISGFHGNTDPVMIFFILVSVYLIETNQPAWLAGIAFGMSLNTKVAGLILIPVILLYLPGARKRIQFAGVAGLTFLIGSMPFIVLGPSIIASKMAGYGSIGGHWGLSRLLTRLPDSLLIIETSYSNWGKYSVISAVIAASLYMNRYRKKPPLFSQCGLILFLFLCMTPGFGVQYLSWLVPFAAIGLTSAVLFYTTSAVFLFMVYNHWSGGFPWYLADSVSRGDWNGPIIRWEIICWCATVMVCSIYFYRMSRFFRQSEVPLC